MLEYIPSRKFELIDHQWPLPWHREEVLLELLLYHKNVCIMDSQTEMEGMRDSVSQTEGSLLLQDSSECLLSPPLSPFILDFSCFCDSFCTYSLYGYLSRLLSSSFSPWEQVSLIPLFSSPFLSSFDVLFKPFTLRKKNRDEKGQCFHMLSVFAWSCVYFLQSAFSPFVRMFREKYHVSQTTFTDVLSWQSWSLLLSASHLLISCISEEMLLSFTGFPVCCSCLSDMSSVNFFASSYLLLPS